MRTLGGEVVGGLWGQVTRSAGACRRRSRPTALRYSCSVQRPGVVVNLGGQTPSWPASMTTHAQESHRHRGVSYRLFAQTRLGSIREADWTKRRCLHIGQSAGASVHWAADGKTATILVGGYQETWDIAVSVPITTS